MQLRQRDSLQLGCSPTLNDLQPGSFIVVLVIPTGIDIDGRSIRST